MPQVGKKWKFSYDGDTVGEVTGISLSIDSNQIEVNSFDVATINRYIKGRSDVTMSLTCLLPSTGDTGQNALIADALNKEETETIVFEPVTPAVGDPKFTGEARPSNASIDADDEEAVSISFDLQISETFTMTPHAL